MSHPFKMIPMLNAENLPDDVTEWCLEHDYSLHCSHDIANVDLEEDNPMLAWLTREGYEFPLVEVERGWGYVAIFGS